VHVALVTHQFFPAFYTGVERIALNLSAQLRRMGHSCVVVTSAEHSSGGTDPYFVDGALVRPVETLRTDLARPWQQPKPVRRALGRVLDEEGTEVLHVLQPMRLAAAFDEAARLRLPVVAHIADFTYLCARVNLLRADGSLCTTAAGGKACAEVCGILDARTRLRWAESTLAAAEAVISPCRFTIDVYGAEGFDTGRWHHVPWGVDYTLHPQRLPAPGRGPLTIGFIGTLLHAKGPRVLVEAARLLPGAELRIELYGGSFHEQAYEAELRALAGDDPRISFEGSYSHEELPRILAGLDAVAIPSLWHENLPTTGLNAIAAGVPLLVSNVGGLVELLDDYDCGFAFRVGDASALAQLLDSLLQDPGLLAGVRRRMRLPPSIEEEAWRIESVYADARAMRA
jgi:glycosyltransferase involved in cell wall biosynthesis